DEHGSQPGLALDRAFRESAEAALQDRMEGYLFALMATVELDREGKITFTRTLPDARFGQPGSGLYARVRRADGTAALGSPSLLGSGDLASQQPKPGRQLFSRVSFNGAPHYLLSYGARWEVAPGKDYPLYFEIAEDLRGFQQQLNRYRRNLWGWLALAAVILLLVQAGVLHRGLKPLRQVTRGLEKIETGQADRLTGQYPAELQQLTDKINSLLEQTRNQLQRYRDSLGNMAHSLKTPLTILGNILNADKHARPANAEARQQLERIRQIIDYQLQRASTAGQTALPRQVALKALIERILAAMQKVYADKGVQPEVHIDTDLCCQCEEGDAMEILGNLIENAFKWSQHRIRVTAHASETGEITLNVEDDGPGIAAEVRQRVLERGQRADPATAGHGIGLAMVQEIVLLYGGRLRIEDSDLGGAAIRITLP
ncbi:MAG TPA: GHKL domain-containing protein, partial [Chromatiales bacterium]|nr:GHKL domain-containing protein [Chromatiales bacterium]